MNKWIVPILAVLLCIGAMVGSVFALKKDSFSDVKNESDCNNRAKLPKSCQTDPNCCTIWQSGMCRKAKMNGKGECVAKGDVVPLLLFSLSLIALVVFIVTLVKAVRKQ
jgi:hypothetical protein